MVSEAAQHKRARGACGNEKGDHLFIGRQARPPFVYTLGHATRESNIRFLCQDKLDKEWFERLYHEELAELGTLEATEGGDCGPRKGDTASSVSASGSVVVDLTQSDDEASPSPLPAHARKRPRMHMPSTSLPTAAVRSRPTPNPRLFPFYIPPATQPFRPHTEQRSPEKPAVKNKLAR